MPTDISGNPSIDLLGKQITELLAHPNIGHGLARTLRAAAKEIEVGRYHRATQRAFPNGPDEQPTKVQIGGGSHQLDGFFNIDLVPPADFLWDVREGIPLETGTVELLFTEHFLEHIDYPRSAKGFAREAFRVLSPGGQIITGVPDAAHVLSRYPAAPVEAEEMIGRWYAKRTCREDINTYLDLINYVFRDQDDDPSYTPHLWAYDAEKLSQLFTEAGFTTIEPWTFDAILANPKREWASVYVIATK
ncbi:class I SAM-dependent methyltransferase [Kitasatospora cineracea]|uniref:Putative SAM-dependent methyltransferase n=1 Tax=Kitasatospora cineracea TaxID=88074 RepID=A0A8G1UAK0_9ACTN|nr:methyltransferase domain-containing protein [Kitasatospora cineracea]ROR37205.1 putative SAM-dependent methyltransferase [Kitasatospora cineracea]